ncbi:hypothetical protein C8R44DRAFT_911058 [Mycena epipterygia]|nr:hypothetical protein C8R44DRAFT_911058 [Mycena epipterygia]
MPATNRERRKDGMRQNERCRRAADQVILEGGWPTKNPKKDDGWDKKTRWLRRKRRRNERGNHGSREGLEEAQREKARNTQGIERSRGPRTPLVRVATAARIESTCAEQHKGCGADTPRRVGGSSGGMRGEGAREKQEGRTNLEGIRREGKEKLGSVWSHVCGSRRKESGREDADEELNSATWSTELRLRTDRNRELQCRGRTVASLSCMRKRLEGDTQPARDSSAGSRALSGAGLGEADENGGRGHRINPGASSTCITCTQEFECFAVPPGRVERGRRTAVVAQASAIFLASSLLPHAIEFCSYKVKEGGSANSSASRAHHNQLLRWHGKPSTYIKSPGNIRMRIAAVCTKIGSHKSTNRNRHRTTRHANSGQPSEIWDMIPHFCWPNSAAVMETRPLLAFVLRKPAHAAHICSY